MKNIVAQYKSEAGNALFLILIAVALFAALSFALFGGGGEQTATSKQGYRITEEVRTQVQAIRSAILECVLVYPDGVAYNRGYPPTPGSGLVEDILCSGNGDANIWSGSGARFLPPPPRPFNAWEYTNDDDGTSGTGVRISMDAPAASAGLTAALTQLDSEFGTDEVEIVTAGTPSITVWIKRNP